jgi:hypothetical protein
MAIDLESQDPRALARLLNIDERRQGRWTVDELGQVLVHQLSAPLLFDLASITSTCPDLTLAKDLGGQPASFGELFRHPQPPIELLQLVKEFAKTSDQRENCPLPSEVSTVLYYAAILSARLRLNEHISTLSPELLRDGIRWALNQPWLGPIRELFVEAMVNI